MATRKPKNRQAGERIRGYTSTQISEAMAVREEARGQLYEAQQKIKDSEQKVMQALIDVQAYECFTINWSRVRRMFEV